MKKCISLLSDGFDSPAATYLMIKREFTPIILSFLTSEDIKAQKQKIIKIVETLSKLTHSKLKIYFISHESNLTFLKQHCSRKLTCVLCKRLMIRIAKELCKTEGTNIIVTGDILGEQASQTLDNLYAYNDLFKNYVILRPLIGKDKLEITNLDKKIGLYDAIAKSVGPCRFNPKYPETHTKLDELRENEKKVEYPKLIQDSLENAEILEI